MSDAVSTHSGQSSSRSHYLSADDGLKLHYREYGSTALPGTPVLCLAGLTRSHRDFHDLAVHLSTDPKNPRRVIALDARGRGLSAYDSEWQNYNVFRELADVLCLTTAIGLHQAHIVGTSRGGILAMLLSASRPGLIRSTVLNDVGPVIETTGLMRIKRTLAELKDPSSWSEAVAMTKRYSQPAFPEFKDEDWDKLARQTFRDLGGKPIVDYDRKLEKLLDAIGTNSPPVQLWPQFKGLTIRPMLVLRGELSMLLRSETVEKMASLHPDLQQITVAQQGHAPVLWDAKIVETIASHMSAAD